MATLNQKTFKLHSWLGLFNGVWMVILGISGALLVYYHEIDRFINKSTLTVTPQQQRLPVDSLYKIVWAKCPLASGTNILHFPQSETDCYSFRVYISDASKPITHWWDTYNIDINPYNGAVLREGYYRDISSSFMHWLLNFHWSLNAGPVGLLIVAIAGLLLFANIITGIIIYRKYFLKALLFKAPVKWSNWRTGTSGLHRYIGVWSLVFNMLIFYSGLQMNWNAFDKSTWVRPETYPKNNMRFASIDKMINDVQHIYPGFDIKYFYIPFTKKMRHNENGETAQAMGNIPGTPSIIPQSSSSISFDVTTGAVTGRHNVNEDLKKMNLWQLFNAVVYSFHVGSFAGNFSRILYIFIGFTPAFLSISGFMLWWRRKGKRKNNYTPSKSTL